MITLPVVLIAAAVLLLLALLLGLFLQRRRTSGATRPGPRTVADLVQQRADREPVPVPVPAGPTVEEPVDDAPADAVSSTVDAPGPADVEEPPAPVPGPAPATAARAIAPLGDDVPWRRAGQLSGASDSDSDSGSEPEPEPEPAGVRRVPALALLRRPSRHPFPADVRQPVVSSAPRLAVVPVAQPAGVEGVATVPVEASSVERTDPEAGSAERIAVERPDVEPADDATAEQAGSEQGDTAPAGAERSGAEPLGAAPTDAVPAGAESLADEPVGGEPVGNEAPEDEAPEDEGPESGPSASVPLLAGGIVAGAIVAIGARAIGRTDSHGAEPDGDATRTEPADTPVEDTEFVPTNEIDVSGVVDRPNPSHVDLVPVDGERPEVGALGSADSVLTTEQDVPAAGTIEPSVADPADEVGEPATAPIAAAAAPGALAGAAALATTRDAPHTDADDFPSTDPDVLFDSPPEAPAADEPAPAPDDVAAEAPVMSGSAASVAEAPGSEAPGSEAPGPEAPGPDTRAPEVPAEPPASTTAPPPAALATAHPTGTATATEPAGRPPRDPALLAAEQAAADLALLRTFGDPSARPERAPIVALEGATPPESPRPVGAAQPVHFRAVRRDGTEVAGAAVALLDDRGHEVATGRSAVGELTAPHPGAYVLVATAPDHQPGAVALAVGDAPVDADVLLVRSAALVGVVTGEDGPLAGARVTLVQDGEVVDVAETDADGAYLVADLASGDYAVSVAAAGCEADVVLVVVADETACVHDVELEPAGVPAG